MTPPGDQKTNNKFNARHDAAGRSKKTNNKLSANYYDVLLGSR